MDQMGNQPFVCKRVTICVQTSGSVPQYCLKAPRQLMSLVLSSSGVSINILNTGHFRYFHKRVHNTFKHITQKMN